MKTWSFLVAAIALSKSMGVLAQGENATTSPTTSPTASPCPSCYNRSSLTIGAATHGSEGDVFWSAPIAALQESARNMGIDLQLLPLAAEGASESDIEASMTSFIANLCSNDEETVGGLVVTLPSNNADLINAVQACLNQDVPVIVMNAGSNLASDALEGPVQHYVGQDEFKAGQLAGTSLVQTCPDCQFYCANHAPTVDVVIERCDGFADAITQAGGTFVTSIAVDANNFTLYQQQVEAAVNITGNWTGVGMLLAGQANIAPGLMVQEAHPGLLLGAIDVDELLYQALTEGKIQFGIDQQSYLQGSMPIPFLTWTAQVAQSLPSFFVDTRSGLITMPPVSCSVIDVCEDEPTPTPTPTPTPSPTPPSTTSSAAMKTDAMDVVVIKTGITIACCIVILI